MTERMEVRFVKLNPEAKMPTYGSKFAAGADLYACIEDDVLVKKGETVVFGTGIACEIPEGYVGLVFARSGLACKKGLAPANKVGVIDSDYRGEIKVALHNHNVGDENTIDTDIVVGKDERIAQLAIVPFLQAEFVEVSDVEALDKTDRGENGFGSSGRF